MTSTTAVTHPDESGRGERDVLTKTELVGGSREVLDSCGDEGPFRHGCPKEDGSARCVEDHTEEQGEGREIDVNQLIAMMDVGKDALWSGGVVHECLKTGDRGCRGGCCCLGGHEGSCDEDRLGLSQIRRESDSPLAVCGGSETGDAGLRDKSLLNSLQRTLRLAGNFPGLSACGGGGSWSSPGCPKTVLILAGLY